MRYDQQVAKIIMSQFSMNTKFCVGASDFTSGEDDQKRPYLQFRTRIDNNRRYIRVTLAPMDLYCVEQILVRAGKAQILYRIDDVYCEDLDETIYRMGSTRHKSDESLTEEWGFEIVREEVA